VQATSFGRELARAAGVEADRAGRITVADDLSLPGHPEIFVVGDLAVMRWKGDQQVPGVAQGAIQSGRHAARNIRARLDGRATEPFRYKDKGNLATIGRGKAIADLGRFRRFSGFPAWVLWLGVHILYLIGFANRLVVLVRWAWSFVTHGRSTRLITGTPLLPEIREPEPPA
jgi:NADH dehydrogenase